MRVLRLVYRLGLFRVERAKVPTSPETARVGRLSRQKLKVRSDVDCWTFCVELLRYFLSAR